MNNIDHPVALGLYGFFNGCILLGGLVSYSDGASFGVFYGLLLGTIFSILSGVFWHYSNKDDPNRKGRAVYKGFLIANGVMIIISIIIGIILLIDHYSIIEDS